MHINGIDEKDNQILNILLKDGRSSYSDIGEQIGLSRTAVKNRIAAMEKSRIISGYRAIINPQQSSEMMTFIVTLDITPEDFENAKAQLTAAEETVTIVQTTGSSHLWMVCLSSNINTMRKYVNNLYKEVPGIKYINAQAVMDVIKGSVIPE